jgi:hypothetical protein
MPALDRTSIFTRLNALTSGSDAVWSALEGLYAPDAVLRATSPLGEFNGADEIRDRLWAPMSNAMQGIERRPVVFICQDAAQGDTGLDSQKVAMFGHLVGEFVAPWCGIEPTNQTVFVRFGEIHEFNDDRIVRTTMFVDFVDLLLQCGLSLFPTARGREILWPGPRFDVEGPSIRLTRSDDSTSHATLERVRAMQHDLHDDATTREQMLAAEHLRHWSTNFSWFGPAGIGSCRGALGFVDHHQMPFRRALPDRVGGGVTKGHFAKFADGPLAVTAGWPSVRGTHLGDGWLGLAASGRSIDLRVADFYSVGPDGLIVDNWVFIDLVHLCEQLGLPTGLTAAQSVATLPLERTP